MESTKPITITVNHPMDAEYIEFVRDTLYDSLGSPFWENHQEVPQLLQWVRTVNDIHKWHEEATNYHGRLIQHYRETEHFDLPDNYIDLRFGEIRRRLDAMDPYLPKTLRNGIRYGCLEDLTRRITDELWSGKLHWLDLFSALIGMALLDGDRWLDTVITPVVQPLQTIGVERVTTVPCHGFGERKVTFRI